MEDRNAHLFRINYMPSLFVILLSSAIVTSSPRKESVVDVMKKDTDLCESIKVLYESDYIKSCATLEFPMQPWNKEENSLDKYLCLGVYDTAYKICRYSDRLPIPLDSVDVFNSYIGKFVPNDKTEENKEEKYCKDNLQGFTLLYNKIEYWGPLVERLGKPHMCQRACFDFNLDFRPLCAVFAWIKSIDDEIKKLNVTSHNPAALDIPKAPVVHQDAMDHLNDKKLEIEPKEIEKKVEVKESKEQLHDKIKDASNNILNERTQPNTEKVESGPEKLDKQETPKTLNMTSKMQDHSPHEKDKESISKVEANTEVPKVPNNVPSKENVNTKDVVKEVNAEETDRKPEGEEIKASTISENTQDRYGVGNAEDEMGDEGIINKNTDTYKCKIFEYT